MLARLAALVQSSQPPRSSSDPTPPTIPTAEGAAEDNNGSTAYTIKPLTMNPLLTPNPNPNLDPDPILMNQPTTTLTSLPSFHHPSYPPLVPPLSR